MSITVNNIDLSKKANLADLAFQINRHCMDKGFKDTDRGYTIFTFVSLCPTCEPLTDVINKAYKTYENLYTDVDDFWSVDLDTILTDYESKYNVWLSNVFTGFIFEKLLDLSTYDLLTVSTAVYTRALRRDPHGNKFVCWLRIECAIEGSCTLEDDETGEVIDDDDYVYIEGHGLFTQETADNSFVMCDRCGKYEDADDTYMVHTRFGTQEWCSECRDNEAFYCEHCEDLYSGEDYDYTYVEGYGAVCNYCLEDSGDFCYCDRCNSWVWYEDYDDDEEMCRNCAEYVANNKPYKIAGYHHRPMLKWFGKKKPKARHIDGTGVELEIDKDGGGWDDRNNAAKYIYDNWGDQAYFNSDGSLSSRGFEIITQPMTDDYMRKTFFPQIDSVFKGLVDDYGYRSHDTDTCGLHFHFSREMFGYGDRRDRALEKFMLFFEDYYDDIVKFSRRRPAGLRWCKKYLGDEYGYNSSKDIKDLAKGKKYADRYHAVNITNRNTVEVRIMRGTLNPDTFKASYDFLYTLVKNSKRIKYSDRYNLTAWFKGMKPETIEYMKSRKAFEAYTAV